MFLVICELNDYVNQHNTHFSLTKGFYLAQGLSKHIDTYYATTGKTQTLSDSLTLKNITEITDKFMASLKYILLIREHNLPQVMDSIPAFSKLFLDPSGRSQKIGIKSDALAWMKSKPMRRYIRETFSRRDSANFLCEHFDFVYVQTEEYRQIALKSIIDKKFSDKIKISPMGVPNTIPLVSKDPYLNPDIYAQTLRDLNSSDKLALMPLCYTSSCINNITHKFPKHRDRIKLIYTGRIRTNGGNPLKLMSDIMFELGDDFELHIFPGRFTIPGLSVSVLSPKFDVNLQMLRDTMFYKNHNVYIHKPFDDHEKANWLSHADIGIDFSSTRPKDVKTPAGHAKLLDYCYHGLPVVAEQNINNVWLVGDNGELIKGVGNVDDYVKAIKRVVNREFDSKSITENTIASSNWDKIAKNVVIDFCI